jgi:hypothetical protein
VRFRIGATLLLFVATAFSQSSSGTGEQAAPPAGFVGSIGIDGSFDSSGHVMDLGTSAGYKFSPHVQVDVGVPFYFLSSPTSGTSTGIGNAALALHLMFPWSSVNYSTSLTTFAPTGDPTLGLSTGRVTFDWNNHLEHDFGRVTPGVDIGLANTIVESKHFLRPFTTLGANAHVSGGASIDLMKDVSLEASAYQILPWGQQKMYSRQVFPGGAGNPVPQHGRAYQQNHFTSGSADLTRDNGFSAGVDVTPIPCFDLYGGYTRSIKYALDEVDFGVGFDLGRAMHVGGCKKK